MLSNNDDKKPEVTATPKKQTISTIESPVRLYVDTPRNLQRLKGHSEEKPVFIFLAYIFTSRLNHSPGLQGKTIPNIKNSSLKMRHLIYSSLFIENNFSKVITFKQNFWFTFNKCLPNIRFDSIDFKKESPAKSLGRIVDVALSTLNYAISAILTSFQLAAYFVADILSKVKNLRKPSFNFLKRIYDIIDDDVTRIKMSPNKGDNLKRVVNIGWRGLVGFAAAIILSPVVGLIISASYLISQSLFITGNIAGGLSVFADSALSAFARLASDKAPPMRECGKGLIAAFPLAFPLITKGLKSFLIVLGFLKAPTTNQSMIELETSSHSPSFSSSSSENSDTATHKNSTSISMAELHIPTRKNTLSDRKEDLIPSVASANESATPVRKHTNERMSLLFKSAEAKDTEGEGEGEGDGEGEGKGKIKTDGPKIETKHL